MTTQREIADRLGLPVHPPKTEIFDLAARTNTDPKQIVRDVDLYRVEPFGLYLARPMPGHPRLRYLWSWLLPGLGLRISRFDWQPGHSRDLDFYLDVVGIERGEDRWRTVDHYLDIEVRTGREARLLDIDEFLVATKADLLDEPTARRALETACAAVEGLARHDYDLAKWLRHNGIELSWPRHHS
ncbi:DUF402 domain-containing protein [Saccharopolyspora erythraea]|uniref:DUF402 domain-containing protein n=1 Tax=Saccharopolyspora erythraea TaxID=1836 RepID=UPI001BA6FB38|nr:DUF402 domain-containing protein [Saccharopolyspora erythraea]QUH00617.1 DUF402 domain-containing protein [Saccharopolyspora erythraea]